MRKTVDKLENGSFRISITGKDGTDYTDYFEYYDSIRCNVFWQQGKWINAYDSCLGPIPDEEVAIFIKPNYDLLRVKQAWQEIRVEVFHLRMRIIWHILHSRRLIP